ncbi:MAG: argininosuccinate lyase [Deinococcales bacterium]
MSATNSPQRMWGGRFQEETDKLVQEFNASINIDKAMALQDIAGSIAHATMLAERGIISPNEAESIIAGLKGIAEDIKAGQFEWSVALEDVHMNIESALTKRIGPLGGKLHTARSRNDQVALDFRLKLREESEMLIDMLRELCCTLVRLAENQLGVIMPGYTHVQVAQPVLFSHHMLAYVEMFRRDIARFQDGLKRINISPLGAGALAGTGFPIDRERTSELLGFSEPARNSLDAVSDRDFAIEFLATCAMTIMHFSRLSEELILWSSQEFSFIQLPDSHTTGSSIMPQKKNPDVSELVRGKTGRIYGNLLGLLTVMKGLPLSYNKDMQEDKEGAFDSAETLKTIILLHLSMLPKMKVNRERMYYAAGRAFSNATDLADYLAKKGLPFREAHEVVGKLVALALGQGKDLQDLNLAEMQGVSGLIDEGVYERLGLEHIINIRNSYGGTSTTQVSHQIALAKAELGMS